MTPCGKSVEMFRDYLTITARMEKGKRVPKDLAAHMNQGNRRLSVNSEERMDPLPWTRRECRRANYGFFGNLLCAGSPPPPPNACHCGSGQRFRGRHRVRERAVEVPPAG